MRFLLKARQLNKFQAVGLALVCAFLLALAGCANTGARADADKAGSKISIHDNIGKISLKTPDGGSLRIADSSGKVIVLDLWATWCGPCRAEIPHLNEISKEYAGRGVEVIGLDIGNEPAEMVNGFARSLGVNYKIAYADDTTTRTLFAGTNGNIPQTYVIGRDGRYLHRFVGFNPERTPEQLRQIIEEAIK